VLDLYFRQCSIAVTCRDLGVMAATLANMGRNPLTGQRAIRGEYVESVLSVMGSCGMYDYAGEWIYRVGMPAKSGVAGGIIAVLPGQLGIGVFSPLLDDHGNSVRGIEVCNKLSLQFNLHVFNVLQSVRSVIRLKYDGSQVASNRQRGRESVEALRALAPSIHVYELQGELVFATAEAVVRDLVANAAGMRYVIVDLKRILSVDQSAGLLLSAVIDVLAASGTTLVFTNASAHRGLRRLVRSRSPEGGADRWMEFEDNNAALAWCEDRLLGGGGEPPEVPFLAVDVLEGVTEEEKRILLEATSECSYEPGEDIVRIGEKADSVFFLTAGRVAVELPLANGGSRQLVSYHPGVVFGEMAFLDGAERSAMVRAETRAVCRELARDAFDAIGARHPALQVKLLHNLLRVLTANLRKANREISILGQ
jgi:glutaminase